MSAKRADPGPGTPPNSRQLVEFRASEEACSRVADLIHREKTTGLSNEETAELENAMQLERIMRLAKARARLHTAS